MARAGGVERESQTLNRAGSCISSLHNGTTCLSFPKVSILPMDDPCHQLRIVRSKRVQVAHCDNIHTLAVHFVANIENERILE